MMAAAQTYQYINNDPFSMISEKLTDARRKEIPHLNFILAAIQFRPKLLMMMMVVMMMMMAMVMMVMVATK